MEKPVWERLSPPLWCGSGADMGQQPCLTGEVKAVGRDCSSHGRWKQESHSKLSFIHTTSTDLEVSQGVFASNQKRQLESFHQNQRGRLGVPWDPWALTTLQPALPCRAAGDAQPSTRLGLSLFQADLMKPSLQMKHNFKDRRVVGRSGDDVCLFLLVSSCLFNYRRC